MSVLCSVQQGYVISHEEFIKKIYESAYLGNSLYKLSFNSSLFEIRTPYINNYNVNTRKKKQTALPTACNLSAAEIQLYLNDINQVRLGLDVLVKEARNVGYLNYNPTPDDVTSRNEEARIQAKSVYLKSTNLQGKRYHGANNTTSTVVLLTENEHYVCPAKCDFFCYDVIDIVHKMDMLKDSYDFILLDPPWWNKYIRRKRAKCAEASYQMMYSDELKKIPLASLLAPGALVAVWCTNCQSHRKMLLEEVFPSWGISYVGKWFWIKVTQSGEPVCPFSKPPGKQPFEQIIFGWNPEIKNRQCPLPEDGRVIVSIPSAIHSHKPPLAEVLQSYLPPHPKCLELFARYLLPDWTSWGFEVLKLQHLDLYHNAEPPTP